MKHPNKRKSYQCPYCKEYFRLKINYIEHLKKCKKWRKEQS
jgi:uncharacterized C2H2 Zn-finger protein